MLADHFGVPAADWPDTGPRYKISPTQILPILRLDPDGRREVATAKWGLIFSWAKAPSGGYNTINAPLDLMALLTTFPAEMMDSFAVSAIVGSPKIDRPECIAPV